MLGIVLIAIIGRQFYKLAEQFNQNKWVYAILGVVSYYLGAFIGGGILGVLDALMDIGIDWDNSLLMTVIAIPFSLGTVFLFYYLLQKNWSRTMVQEPIDEIQDIGKSMEDQD